MVDLAVEPSNVYSAAEPILSSVIREPSVNSGCLRCRRRQVFEYPRAFVSVRDNSFSAAS